MASSALAAPVVYQCAPIAMTNAEWSATYTYATPDGEINGSNRLVIGPVDLAAAFVVPGHMEGRVLPRSTNIFVFMATYEPAEAAVRAAATERTLARG